MSALGRSRANGTMRMSCSTVRGRGRLAGAMRSGRERLEASSDRGRSERAARPVLAVGSRLAAVTAVMALAACPREAPRPVDRGEAAPTRSPAPSNEVLEAAPEPVGSDAARPDAPAPDADAGAPRVAAVPGQILERFELTDGPVDRSAASRLEREAYRALGANDLEAAERLWTEVLAADPTNERAWGELSLTHLRAERYDRCVEAAERCLARVFGRERLGACAYNLGQCHARLGHDEAAVEAYLRSLEWRRSAAVERMAATAAKRLGRGPLSIEREAAEARVRAAARQLLARSCAAPASTREDGAETCGPITAWGIAGSFSAAGASEVLLAVHDDAVSHQEGSGYGVLMRSEARGWVEVGRTPLLAPGDGGVDFLELLPTAEGTVIPIVQVSDCSDGCCAGAVSAVRFARADSGTRIALESLFPVGSATAAAAAPGRRALVTGARRIASTSGPQSDLLLRSETRVGRGRVVVRYLRVMWAEGRVQVTGAVPTAGDAPHCDAGTA